ncbi:MBL fold metallo-hydrolase [Pedomonas mirosovicensis]|uniref:MBL fold metallo-hydrolase n=1 Tax=Pedomonas mirosovicensis TaxID=2908641 RepID=UPI00216A2AC5|nr:MBL fold metallo-hydrolase [Pedomonas mirosovicensis]MCH8684738.1 MBL fold metallo-hydrolase [Pedomonas mirosovicensis]
MTDDVRFVQDSAVAYGEPLTMSPLIRRVVARNANAFTYTGTGTYIVGRGTVAIIDPGPDMPDHIEAVLKAVEGETVSHLVITHTHRDHSPAARALKEKLGAPIVGCAQVKGEDGMPAAEEAVDWDYVPDTIMAEGDAISGPGWTLEALETPGHTSTHLCFALPEEKVLFTGDHVMGWATSVIAPPDGDMAAYMASLKKLLDRDDERYYPTHGAPVENPRPFVRALINHRRMREGQLLKLLADGPMSIPQMVEVLYVSTPKYLHKAAERSVEAHLIDLETRGRVAHEGGVYRLVEEV